MATQTANVIDLAAYREACAHRQAPAVTHELTPPTLSPMAFPFLPLPPVPGYWFFWMPVLLPQFFAPAGALLDAN